MFETERLRARLWSEDDAPAAFDLWGDARVVHFLGGEPEATVEAARERVRWILARDAGLPEGMGNFALELRGSGEIVGAALIKPLPEPAGAGAPSPDAMPVEMGWHLIPRHWGNGYATEAGRALARWGFETLGLEQIHVVIRPDNTASLAVAERLGLPEAGFTDAYYGIRLRHFVLTRAGRERRDGAGPA